MAKLKGSSKIEYFKLRLQEPTGGELLGIFRGIDME